MKNQEKKFEEKVAPAPDMAEMKQLLAQLFQKFVQDEQGNRVTQNNMAGLFGLVSSALDGNLQIKQPE